MSAVPAAAVAAGAVVAAQVLKAAHRSDLPSFSNQDPSGTFGSPDLPLLRVVAIGDSSITAPGVIDLDNTWVRRIAHHFSDRYRIELSCLAVGGSKARDVIEGQLAEAVRMAPDIVILSVGANDAIRSPSTERYETDLRHIVERLEPVAGAILMLGMGDLGSIPRLPPLLRPMLTKRSEQYDGIATAVAAASPKTVKVYTRARVSRLFWEDRDLFAGDQFHAGDGGHEVFADEAIPAFRAALRIAGR